MKISFHVFITDVVLVLIVPMLFISLVGVDMGVDVLIPFSDDYDRIPIKTEMVTELNISLQLTMNDDIMTVNYNTTYSFLWVKIHDRVFGFIDEVTTTKEMNQEGSFTFYYNVNSYSTIIFSFYDIYTDLVGNIEITDDFSFQSIIEANSMRYLFEPMIFIFKVGILSVITISLLTIWQREHKRQIYY